MKTAPIKHGGHFCREPALCPAYWPSDTPPFASQRSRYRHIGFFHACPSYRRANNSCRLYNNFS